MGKILFSPPIFRIPNRCGFTASLERLEVVWNQGEHFGFLAGGLTRFPQLQGTGGWDGVRGFREELRGVGIRISTGRGEHRGSGFPPGSRQDTSRFFAHHPQTERRLGPLSLRMTISFLLERGREDSTQRAHGEPRGGLIGDGGSVFPRQPAGHKQVLRSPPPN